MSNYSEISGNQNIVIQNVNGSQISIVVNGEAKELLNGFIELKALMEAMKVMMIQFAQGNYAIHELDETSFEFVTGKRAFNSLLTRQLIHAIEPFNQRARDFLSSTAREIIDWEFKRKTSDYAREIIASAFVGVLGVQLRKLIAIGKEDHSEVKQRKYLENCLLTTQKALELLNFTLISRLWDFKREREIPLSTVQLLTLKQFFSTKLERDLPDHIQLLQNLTRIFNEQALQFPVPEMAGFLPQLEDGTKFLEACIKMEDLYAQLESSQVNLLACYKAEQLMVTIMEPLFFFANYKMVSIKNVGYHEMRNKPPGYLHSYSALEMEARNQQVPELVSYEESPIITDAVLLYSGRYQQSVNLFPFIIDLNAIGFEDGAKICFFSCRDDGSNGLHYRFLNDNSRESIYADEALKTEKDMNTIMRDRQKQKLLKLNTVIEQFEEAAQTILGSAATDSSTQADNHV